MTTVPGKQAYRIVEGLQDDMVLSYQLESALH